MIMTIDRYIHLLLNVVQSTVNCTFGFDSLLLQKYWTNKLVYIGIVGQSSKLLYLALAGIIDKWNDDKPFAHSCSLAAAIRAFASPPQFLAILIK